MSQRLTTAMSLIHHHPAAGGDRPRLRLDAHRFSPYACWLGAGRYCRVDYSE